jgi:GrpB-like predicted nucleotidyltransferase (UPF0157 family)
MLTKSQQEWIDTLSDSRIVIVPYDDRTERLFSVTKARIHRVLGSQIDVQHCGASSFGISGQDEIDVSILATQDVFDDYISKLEKEFGAVKSRYPDRARFEVREEGKKIDLKIVDINHEGYKNAVFFETYLREHPEYLEKYRILKESCNGVTVKEYYRQKIEFINGILEMNKG